MEWRIGMGANVRTRRERRHVDARTGADQRCPPTGEGSVTRPLRSVRVERNADVAEVGLAPVHLFLAHKFLRRIDQSIYGDAEVRINGRCRGGRSESLDTEDDAVVADPTIPRHRMCG